MALTKVSGTLADAATETTSGVVELATEAEINTGSDTARAVSPGRLYTALGFSDYFQSTAQTITAGGELTIAHGLGRAPIFVQASIVCTATNQSYAENDEVVIALGGIDAATNSGMALLINSTTNLVVRFGSVISVTERSSGACVAIDTTKWTLRLRAWA